MELVWIVLADIVLLAVLICGMYRYFRQREARRLDALQEMLDAAMRKELLNVRFDESRQSVLENSLRRYLLKSELCAQELKEQKEVVQGLITDISHQSTTPIANILLYSELLGEQGSALSEEALAIHEQAEKLDFLIQSLVKLSRLETGLITVKAGEEKINAIFQALERQFASRAERAGVTLKIEPVSITARFDLKWTVEAVSNIVDNALKYTPRGGLVQVRACKYQIFARIDILDTGIGIAREEQNKIFNRFYRSMEAEDYPGAGVGLSLAREILRMEEGYLKVDSQKGKGTRFSAFLLL